MLDIILKNGDMYIPSQGHEEFEPLGKIYSIASPSPSNITRVYVGEELLGSGEYSYASGTLTLVSNPAETVRVYWDTGVETYDPVIGESVSQRINVRLKWFVGESVFYPTYGTDYFGKVFVKNPSKSRIIPMISKVIRETEGVISVESIDMEINQTKRQATIRYTAKTTKGLLEEEVALWTTA